MTTGNSNSTHNWSQNSLHVQSTQRGFYNVPPDPAIFHERGQPLSVHSTPWPAILISRGAIVVVRGEKHDGLPLVRVTRYQ